MAGRTPAKSKKMAKDDGSLPEPDIDSVNKIKIKTNTKTGNDNKLTAVGIESASTTTPFKVLRRRFIEVTVRGEEEEAVTLIDRMWAIHPARATRTILEMVPIIDGQLLAKIRTIIRVIDHFNMKIDNKGDEQATLTMIEANRVIPKLSQKAVTVAGQRGGLVAAKVKPEIDPMGCLHPLLGDDGLARLKGKISANDRNWRTLETLAKRCSTLSMFFDRLQWGYSKVEEYRRQKQRQWTPSVVIKYGHIEAAVSSFNPGGAPGFGEYSTPSVLESHYVIPDKGLGPFMLRPYLNRGMKLKASCRFAVIGEDIGGNTADADKGVESVSQCTIEVTPSTPLSIPPTGLSIQDQATAVADNDRSLAVPLLLTPPTQPMEKLIMEVPCKKRQRDEDKDECDSPPQLRICKRIKIDIGMDMGVSLQG